MSCDYQSVLAASKCFECIPQGVQLGVQTSLLNEISGANLSVDQLIYNARCIASCIPPGMLEEVKTRLLCERVDSLSPTPTVAECIDSDAQAFVAASGITDETQIYAVCKLVTDLKTYPAAGTKYWDREILIYPFVGGNAAAHAVNLKTPGVNNLSFLGATPPIHSVYGVQGRLATCWADTGYTIKAANRNNLRSMYYIDIHGTVNLTMMFGCGSAAGEFISRTAAQPFNFEVNDLTSSTSAAAAKLLGAYFIQRKEAANKQYAQRSDAWSDIAIASTGTSIRTIFLFSGNFGAAVSPSNVRLSSFTLGTCFDIAGGQAEKDEYKSIWDQFHARLGRGHP